MRLIAHSIINLILLIGVRLRTLRNRNDQKVVLLTIFINTIYGLSHYSYGRSTVIEGNSKDFVYIVSISVYSGYIAVIFHTDYNRSSVCVGKCDNVI